MAHGFRERIWPLSSGHVRSIIAAGIVVALALALSIAIAARSTDSAGGAPVPLDVDQDAVADANGIELSVNAAAFSGTTTLLAVSVDGSAAAVEWGLVSRIVVPRSAITGGLAVPTGTEALVLGPAGETVIRLAPVDSLGDTALTIELLELRMNDGGSEFVSGPWNLPLTFPSDMAARLRLEHLAGTSVEDSGVKIDVVGSVRSTTETLVTLKVTSDEPIEPLGQPTLLVDGERLSGGLIAEAESGALLTYTFPPTEFGSDVTLDAGSFVKEGSVVSGSVAFDAGSVIERQDLQAEHGQVGVILPADVRSQSGAELLPISLEFDFSKRSSSPHATGKSLKITIDGAHPGRRGYSVNSADGGALAVGTLGVGYNKDSMGRAVNPRTELWVWWDDLEQLDGVLTVTYSGAPEEIVRGNWKLELSP